MENWLAAFQTMLDALTSFLEAYPLAVEWYTAFVRFLFPVLAVLILYRAVRSLLKLPHTPETWGQLSLPNGTPSAQPGLRWRKPGKSWCISPWAR